MPVLDSDNSTLLRGDRLGDQQPRQRMLDQLSELADYAGGMAAKLDQLVGRFAEQPASIDPRTAEPTYGQGYGEDLRRLRINLDNIGESLEKLWSLA